MARPANFKSCARVLIGIKEEESITLPLNVSEVSKNLKNRQGHLKKKYSVPIYIFSSITV